MIPGCPRAILVTHRPVRPFGFTTGETSVGARLPVDPGWVGSEPKTVGEATDPIAARQTGTSVDHAGSNRTGRFGFLIADVSGHGVPAALVAAMVKVAFQAQAGQGKGPGTVLTGMNEMLGHRLEGQFVTAGYMCIDTGEGTMSYAGAGHPPLYVLSGRHGLEGVLSGGLMLGPFPDAHYSSTERRLEPGDRVLMYTDGIVEAFNEKNEEFGDQRLKDLLAASTGLSGDGFADWVLEEVKRWTGVGRKRSLTDDLTMIVIDVLPQTP